VTASPSAVRRRERADRAARLRAAGWSLRQIARSLGVADSTIRADLRAAPVPLRRSPVPRPWSGDWRPEAVRLRVAGHPDHQGSQPMPFRMIAERLAVAEEDVRRHFARLAKRDKRARQAATLRACGLSLRAVAGRLGISEATVRRDLAAEPPVRHPAARFPDISPGNNTGIAHPEDAHSVIQLRRISR
jgi:lambda repressor-like predicted transcriptional regulator